MSNMFDGASSLSNAQKGQIHKSFSSNPNWPYDWAEYANAPPHSLTLSDSNFSENLPIGSIIGVFSAIDPDENSTLSFSLNDANGSDDHSHFYLEENGTLLTASEFDYEANFTSYDLHVDVSDNYGTKISNIFRINLIDSDEAPKFNHSDSTTFYRIPKNTLSAPIGSYDSEIAFEKVYVSGIEDIEENGGYLQNLLPLRSGKYLLTGNVINRSIRDSPDYVAVVLDSNLNKLWTKSFGGNEKDFHTNAVELKSGSFLIGGSSDSPPSGSKVSNSFGGMDFWLICVDQNGSKLWDRSYGGTGDEKLEKILPTADGGFLLIGNSDSNKSASKSLNSLGNEDIWCVKIDPNGNQKWDISIGTEQNDRYLGILPLSDGQFRLLIADEDGQTTLHYIRENGDSYGRKIINYRSITAIIEGKKDHFYLVHQGKIDTNANTNETRTGRGPSNINIEYFITNHDRDGMEKWALKYNDSKSGPNISESINSTGKNHPRPNSSSESVNWQSEVYPTMDGGVFFHFGNRSLSVNDDGTHKWTQYEASQFFKHEPLLGEDSPTPTRASAGDNNVDDFQNLVRTGLDMVELQTGGFLKLFSSFEFGIMAMGGNKGRGGSNRVLVDRNKFFLTKLDSEGKFFDFECTDPENEVLEWKLSKLPRNGNAELDTSNNSKLSIYYTPERDFVGYDSFVVLVSDGSNSSEIEVEIEVVDTKWDEQQSSTTTDSDFEHNSEAPINKDDNSTDLVDQNDSSFEDNNTTNPDKSTEPEYFRPLVRTGEASAITSSSVTFSGIIIDDGNRTISEHGILLSTHPLPQLGHPRTKILPIDQNSSGFKITANQLKADTNYFYRAYAINAEGLSVGSIKSFSTKELHTGPGWIDAQPIPDTENWWSNPWLGNFYIAENNGWIMHENLGWMFVLGQPDRSIWLWKEEMGWLWTSSETYPFLYSNQSGGWLFYHGQLDGTLLFYDYADSNWLIIIK